ncbi:MAG: TonB-dependent receptor [Sphingomonadales bacterium]|nr:MAG: TonB-dependent receptor [Sphingomonadales bacterium]
MRLLLSTATLVACIAQPAFSQTAPVAEAKEAQDAQAEAQPETQSGGLSEIVVTAQRRSESVQNVPIAISAFSSDQLQRQGVSNTLELGNFVPNLVAQNNTGVGSANAYYLRGLGTAESIPTFDPPVGTYVDDIYLSRQNGNNLSLFDVERVEVLRGPQGTLFGRNTTGGAISVIMRDPGEVFGGYGEIGYGSYNKMLVRGSVDVPIAPGFSVKASGYWQEDDGYVKNVTTGDQLNDDDGWGVRLGVRGELGSSAVWTASYTHIIANGENIINYACNPKLPTQCDDRYSTTGLREGVTSATSLFAPLVISGRKANYMMGNRSVSDIITSKLRFDVGPDMNLDIITGFTAQTQQYALDFYDGRGGPSITAPNPAVQGWTRGGFTILNDGDQSQFTQEIKLNGSLANGLIDFVGGAYYLFEQNRTDFADVFSLSQASALLLGDRILRNSTEAMAGYLQTDINFTEKLKLTGGIRYTEETKEFSINDNRPSCNDGTVEASCLDNRNLISGSGRAIPTSQKAKIWTPRFAVNYQADRDLLMFVSATRGFKSGGWNARGSSATTFVPFGPESVWSYEAGIKSQWFDRHLRANITAFYMNVSDLQTPSAFVSPTGSITFLTRNFADYVNRGIEAEFTVIPVTGLNLYANIGFQKDKYKIDRSVADIDAYGIQSVNAQQRACKAILATGAVPGGTGTAACGAGIVTATGNISEPVRTPDLTVAMGASYEIPVSGNGMTLVPSFNASYRGDQEVAANNFSIYSGAITGTNGTYPGNPYGGTFINGAYSAATWTFGANVTLNGPENRWQLSAGCTNCFNDIATNTSLANTTYINPPMMWTVKFRHNF